MKIKKYGDPWHLSEPLSDLAGPGFSTPAMKHED
jgi:hypothetical protein